VADEELKVKITGDTTGLKGALDKAGGMVTGFSTNISKIGRTATVAGGVVTAAFTKTFLDFTAYETKLVDMAKVTSEPFDQIEAKLGTVDVALGNSKELMEGYYQVISAGVKDPVEALGTLTVAAETAKAGHLEQSEAVKGITKMMAGYEGAISSAAVAADLLFAIEKEGQTTVAEMIPVIGGLAKMSFDVGIGQEAMAAAIAVVSKTAGSGAEAATQYQAVISGLMKPTTDMSDAFLAIGEKIRGVGEGYKDAEEMIKDLGLVDALKAIQEHSDATGVSIADLFGRKEAMIGFSALGAEGFRTLDATIVSVGEGVGGAKKAFEEWSDTGAASIDEIKNTFLNFSSEIGKQLAPMVKDLLGKITEVITKVREWASANPELFESLVKGAAIIGGIAAVGGPIMMAVGAITAILSPVGLVVAAVIALGVAWATNFGGIRDITKSVWEFVKGVFDKLVNFISESFERLKKIIDFIKKAVAGIGKAATEGVTVGPETSEGFGVGGTSVGDAIAKAGPPFHATGIDYVPRKAFYGLDPGEKVLKASEARAYDQRQTTFSPNIQVTVQGDGDAGKIKQVVEQALNEAARQYNRRGFEMVPGIG